MTELQWDQNALAGELHALLEELAEFNATPGEGITRLAFSRECREAAWWLRRLMESKKLDTRIDPTGAVIGRLEGDSPRTVVIASHYDTVQNGGKFDGAAGIICGILILSQLKKQGIRLPYSLEVIATHDEEGARFEAAYFSTKGMFGLLKMPEEELYDKNGISLSQAMKDNGVVVEKLPRAARRPGEIAAFFEIHIEQGIQLESAGIHIGLVDRIVGLRRSMITITGRPDHAGATPMPLRLDAMDNAARVIAEIGNMSRRRPGTVATVGQVLVEPNVVNIIARQVKFSLDIRTGCQQELDEMHDEVLKILREQMDSRLTWTVDDTLNTTPPGIMSPQLVGLLEEECRRERIDAMHLNSGAGHDSLVAAGQVPTAMLFVPSKDGRSHCPEEETDCRDLALACNVLANVLLRLPEELDFSYVSER